MLDAEFDEAVHSQGRNTSKRSRRKRHRKPFVGVGGGIDTIVVSMLFNCCSIDLCSIVVQ